MKTPERVLTEAYAHAPADGRDYNHTWIIEAMRAFAREACREQREICADAAQLTTGSWGKEINRVAIKNAPEPKMI